jgi:hypothetical protein
MEAYCENPANDVFVDVDSRGASNLLRNSFASPGAIAAFHFNDGIDQFFRRPLGTRPTNSFWGKQKPILLLDQRFVKMQQKVFKTTADRTTRAGRIKRVHKPAMMRSDVTEGWERASDRDSESGLDVASRRTRR